MKMKKAVIDRNGNVYTIKISKKTEGDSLTWFTVALQNDNVNYFADVYFDKDSKELFSIDFSHKTIDIAPYDIIIELIKIARNIKY